MEDWGRIMTQVFKNSWNDLLKDELEKDYYKN